MSDRYLHIPANGQELAAGRRGPGGIGGDGLIARLRWSIARL